MDLKEIQKCLDELKEKRETLNKSIQKEEKIKLEIQRRIQKLTEELAKINESLTQKTQARHEFDATINETESAYNKILESSQTLLHVLKRETNNLVKKRGVDGSAAADAGAALSSSEYKGAGLS